MKTRPFKNSEVGPIPADWEVFKLGQIIADGHAKLQTGPFGTVLKASEFVESGHPVVSVREIRNGYIQLYADTPCVNDETYKRLGRYALQAADLVFARKGNVERSALIPSNAVSFFLGSDGISLRLDSLYLSPRYALYFLQSDAIKQYVARQAYGTTMAGLNETILQSIPFVIPPLSEQQHISATLADVDEWIASLDKLIEKKKLAKQGTMQALLFGKTRLPGFEGKWVERRLGECGYLSRNSINPQMFPTQNFFDFSMPNYDAGKEAQVVFGSQLHSLKTPISGNVLLFNKLNVRQKRIWLVENCPYNAICSSEFLPFYSDDINLQFLSFYLGTDKSTHDFIECSTGTSNSQKRITPKIFLDYIVVIPPTLAEQVAIASVLSDMDAELAALSREKAKAEQIKQGMMQELLTGKTRLKGE